VHKTVLALSFLYHSELIEDFLDKLTGKFAACLTEAVLGEAEESAWD
jgi:hypothetical protein